MIWIILSGEDLSMYLRYFDLSQLHTQKNVEKESEEKKKEKVLIFYAINTRRNDQYHQKLAIWYDFLSCLFDC